MTADDTREALDRLQDAISGERGDWREVTVRPDDIAAALAAIRGTEAGLDVDDNGLPICNLSYLCPHHRGERRLASADSEPS